MQDSHRKRREKAKPQHQMYILYICRFSSGNKKKFPRNPSTTNRPCWFQHLWRSSDWHPKPQVFLVVVAVFLLSFLEKRSYIIEKKHMGVSKNRGIPKSSILIGFSIINQPLWLIVIFTSWWFQPIWKIWSSNWIMKPQGSGWKFQKIFELPPPSI